MAGSLLALGLMLGALFAFGDEFDINQQGLFVFLTRFWYWNDVSGYGRRSNRIRTLSPAYNMNNNNSEAFLKTSLRMRWASQDSFHCLKSKLLGFTVKASISIWVLINRINLRRTRQYCRRFTKPRKQFSKCSFGSLYFLIKFFIRLLNWSSLFCVGGVKDL